MERKQIIKKKIEELESDISRWRRNIEEASVELEILKKVKEVKNDN